MTNYNRLHSMWDAQAAVGFVMSQAAYIEPTVNKIQYPETQWQTLVPVDSSAPEFVKTVTYTSIDTAGKAQWINGNADDVPRAEVERAMAETAVYTAGIGYGYGWEEINYAQAVGVPLEAERVGAAKRAYMEFMDDVGLYGSTLKGGTGLVNNSSVSPAAAPNGDWGGTGSTEQTIIEDINDVLFAGAITSKFIYYPTHLLLPYTKLQYLASLRIEGTSDRLLDYIIRTNAVTALTGRPLVIRGVRGLETAGATSNARMIAYHRSPEVLKMHVPMLHRFLQPYSPGPLRVDVPGVFRTAPGVDIRQPAAVTYRDGI